MDFLYSREERPKGDRGEDVPPSNTSVPPDSHDPTGPCPRCGLPSTFALLGSMPITWGGHYSVTIEGQHQRESLDRVSAFQCRACGQGVAVVEEQWTGGHPSRLGVQGGGVVSYRGVHWWPPV